MGVVIKQSFWGTAMAYLGVLVGYANTLYIRPKYFEMEQIGLFTLVTSNAMMLSPLCSFGFAGTYVKFFPSFKTTEERHALFTFHLLITLFFGGLIFGIGILAKPWVASYFQETTPEYIKFLSVTGIVMLANSFFAVLMSYSNSILKVILPSIIQEVYLKLGSMLLVVGYAMGLYDFETAANGLAVVYTLTWIILLSYQYFVHKLRFNFDFHFINPIFLSSIFKYALFFLVTTISFGIFNNISNSQISSMLGSQYTGIFSTCFFIGVIVEMPRRNAAKVIAPIISQAFVENDMQRINSIFKRGSITMTTIGSLLMIGIITNISDLMAFIPKGNELALGIYVVIGVSVGKVLLMLSGFPGETITFSKHYLYNIVFQALTAVFLLTFNYFLIPIWGVSGAGISYLLTVSIDILLRLTFVYYHFKIHPFSIKHLTLLGIVTVVFLFAYHLDFGLTPILNIAVRSVLTAIVFALLVYLLKISEDITKIVDLGLSKLGIILGK